MMETDKNAKIASYLLALDESAGVQFCLSVGLDPTDVYPFDFQNAEDVYNCLAGLMGYSARELLGYLFDCPAIWGMYLTDITPARYHDGISLLLQAKNREGLMLYFRACHRFGYPALEDEEFDILEALYIRCTPSLHYLLEQTYDDDEYSSLVVEAIRLSGVKSAGTKGSTALNAMNLEGNTDYSDLNTEKSKSIRPTVTEEEAFEFWQNAPMCQVHFSLKIDGINSKLAFDENGGGLKLALSRGRSADSLDYTQALSNAFAQQGVHLEGIRGRATGEAFVGITDLVALQAKYPDRDYKSPKSTALAMLRAPQKFSYEDFKMLTLRVFDVNGLRPDVGFAEAEAAGLLVPPCLQFGGEEIPRTSIEEFNAWMQENVLDPLWAQATEMGIGSDGVVMYLLADINTERKDKYSDSNIAIKYSHWKAKPYRSRVTDLVFAQGRVEMSIVLEVEPVITRDMNTATRVGIGSPDILIKDGVKVGDLIEFERKSEAYNVYLRKVGEDE